MADILQRAKRYVQAKLQDYVAPIKKEPTVQTAFSSRRTGGSPLADIGDNDKASGPPSGSYPHNSPAKPL
jgi:hypothetical protein